MIPVSSIQMLSDFEESIGIY